MWSFFAMAAEQEERSIILSREEFKAGGILKWVDIIFFTKSDTVRSFQGMEIGKSFLNKGGAACASEKENRFIIFTDEWFSLRKFSL